MCELFILSCAHARTYRSVHSSNRCWEPWRPWPTTAGYQTSVTPSYITRTSGGTHTHTYSHTHTHTLTHTHTHTHTHTQVYIYIYSVSALRLSMKQVLISYVTNAVCDFVSSNKTKFACTQIRPSHTRACTHTHTHTHSTYRVCGV